MKPNFFHKNLKFQFLCVSILVIFLSTAFFVLSFYFVISKVEISSATRLLDTALKTAWAEFYNDPKQLQGILVEASQRTEIKDAITESGQEKLHSTITNWQEAYPHVNFWTILDAQGKVLCNTNSSHYQKWHLHYLLEKLTETSPALISTELVPASVLKEENPHLFCEAEIPVQNLQNNFTDALINVVVTPVLDKEHKIIGYLSGGFLLNDNTLIPENYTKKIPHTYLSIGVKGIRITSNIKTTDLYRPIGSLQETELIEHTSRGEQYRGVMYVNGKKSLIASDPIKNCTGEVIGNLGVGAPVDLLTKFKRNGIKAFLLLAFVILCIATFFTNKLSSITLKPIYQLKKIAHDVTNEVVVPEKITWSNEKTPTEISELAYTIISMAQALKQKESEAQTYAQELSDEKAKLEIKVQERTHELAHTVAELETTNQYKSQFLANMSHELRTPLISIIGFAQLLADEVAGKINTSQRRYTKFILSSANQLLEMINDILDLIKVEQNKDKLRLDYFPLPKLIEHSLCLFEGEIKKKDLQVSIDVEADLPQPFWDMKKIKQVLANLLSNAIKFTPQNGAITVAASQQQDKLLIKVQDTGIGIKPENHQRVFLAFEQAESSYTRQFQGTGLGLSISKKFVELHGGQIWLESEVDKGTTLYVLIPIMPIPHIKKGGK